MSLRPALRGRSTASTSVRWLQATCWRRRSRTSAPCAMRSSMSRFKVALWASAAAACLLSVWCRVAVAADAAPTLRPQVESFIAEMVEKHGLARAELRALMQQARLQRDILRAMSAQTTARTWRQYRPSYINPQRIAGGVKFWAMHAAV